MFLVWLMILSNLFLTCRCLDTQLHSWKTITYRQRNPDFKWKYDAVFIQPSWWGDESRVALQALECVSEATVAPYLVQVLPRDHVPLQAYHSQPAFAYASDVLSQGSVPGGPVEALESKLRALTLPTGGRFHLARSQITGGNLLHSLQFLTCPHLILKIISVVLHP